MKSVIDYVSGRISSDEFKAIWHSDPQIGIWLVGIWLDNLIDLRSEPKPEWKQLPYPEYRMAIHKHYHGSVLQFINASERSTIPAGPSDALDFGWHFHSIAAIIVVAFPDVVPTTYYDEEETFYYSVVSDYVGGREVDGLIAEVISQFPKSLGKTKRKKEAKAAIKNLFHIEGGRYPRWVQEPEWPMGKQSPMAYVKQCRDGDLVKFIFRDVDTGEIKEVEQFY